MKSFYNIGTGIPPRSPLERFKRRCTGHLDAHHNPARPVRLRPLSCGQPKPHSEPQRGTYRQQVRTAAGSNGVQRAAGVGQGWDGVVQEQAEG